MCEIAPDVVTTHKMIPMKPYFNGIGSQNPRDLWMLFVSEMETRGSDRVACGRSQACIAAVERGRALDGGLVDP